MAAQQKKKAVRAGRNKDKCANYRQRETQTKTAKTRRILRAIKQGIKQPGWRMKEDGKHVFRA